MATDTELAIILRLRDEFTAAMRKTMKGTRGEAKRAQGAFDGLGKSMRRAVAAAGGFLLVRRGIRETIGAAVEYEDQLAEVSTLMDDVTLSITGMGDALLGVGEEFGQTPEALTKGLYDAVSAGVANASNSLEFMGKASKLAVAGVTDVATSVDLLTSVLNGFGLGADGADRASDALFRTVKLGKTTIRELAGSIGRVVPAAAAVGLTIEQTGAALAAMTLSGLSTEEATTALRQTLVVLANTTEEARKEAEKLGLSLSLEDLQSDPVEFFTQLGKATEGNIEKLRVFIPNVRALVGALNLAANDGENFRRVMADMDKSIGSTDAAFAKMSQTTGFALRQLRAGLTRDFIAIGAQLLPELKGDVQDLGKELRSFFAENRTDIVEFLRDVGTAIREFMVGLVTVFKAIGPILEPVLAAITARMAAFVTVLSAKLALIAGAFEIGVDAGGFIASAFTSEAEAQQLADRAQKVREDATAAAALMGSLTLDAIGKVGGQVGVGEAIRNALKDMGLLRAALSDTDEVASKSARRTSPIVAAAFTEQAKRAAVLANGLRTVARFAKTAWKALSSGFRDGGPVDAFTRPDLGDIIQQAAARGAREFGERDAVDDYRSALETLGELQGRIDVLQLPEGFARDARTVRQEFAGIASIVSKMKLPQETFDALMEMLATLEGLEIEALKSETADASAAAIRDGVQSIGPVLTRSLSDAIIDGFEDGFAHAKDIAASAARAISSILFQAGIKAALVKAVPSLFGAAAATGGTFNTGGGAVIPLRAMAGGGITRGPEIVLRGEAGAEAVVPLPDGRSIPVQMLGGDRGGAGMRVEIAAATLVDRGFDQDSRLVRRVQAIGSNTSNVRQQRDRAGGSRL